MNVLTTIWNFFEVNILTQPAFFVGLIVLLGYALLRRPLRECLAGFIKATVGYMILSVGSGNLVSTFRPIMTALSTRFNLSAAVLDPYFGQVAARAAIDAIGRSVSVIMSVILVGFLFNVALVALRKATKIRTVYTTGHVMIHQSCVMTWIFMFLFPEMNDLTISLVLGVLLGTFWAVSSNMTVEPTQKLTDGGNFAVGHQQMFGVWFADKIGSRVGRKNKKSIEDIKLPGFLQMFNDSTVATSILMLLFFGTIIVILGPDLMHELDTGFGADQSFFFYIISKAFAFTVNLNILMYGVRMFVAELSESFQGISDKLLPGSLPAVDCAATFGFGHPNAVTLGFIFGALGQFLVILGLVVFKSPILVITGFIPVFFDNGAMALFANRNGGLRAVFLVTFFSGILQALGGAIMAHNFQFGLYGGVNAGFDIATLFTAAGFVLQYLKYIGVGALFIILMIIPQIMYRKNKETYFLVAQDYDKYKEVVSDNL